MAARAQSRGEETRETERFDRNSRLRRGVRKILSIRTYRLKVTVESSSVSRITIEREEYRESVGKRNLEKKNLEERTRLKKIDRARRMICVVGFEVARRIICM